MTTPENESPVNKAMLEELARRAERDPFATELVRARHNLGWSQGELSAHSGVSRESIKAYESGRNKPGYTELRKLSAALQISPNKLVSGSDEFVPPRSPLKDVIDDPESNEAKQKYRLIALFSALTAVERNALITLIEPLIMNRYGGEQKFREEMSKLDDISFTITRADASPLEGGLRELLEETTQKSKKKSK